jgi:hypothetical protein
MHEPATSGACANCGVALGGRYCSACGQRASPPRPTLHDLFHEAFHEFAHVDGKIFRTAKLLLFAPGRLTREFLDGRRTAFVTPIRLYLLCSLLFFGTVHYLPFHPLHVSVDQGSPARMQEGAARINRNPELLAHTLSAAVPKALFLLMPLFALSVFALYRRREPTYVPHLYFAVHFHAFACVLLSLVAVMVAANTLWLTVPGLMLFFLLLPYLGASLRTVYDDRSRARPFKALAIWAVYGLVLFALVAAITYWTIVHA